MQLFAAVVQAVTPPYLQVAYSYQGTILPSLCRPVQCGATTGLHWMPAPGDAIWLVQLEQGMPVALCGLAAPTPAQLATAAPLQTAALQAGETALYGPTGNVLRLVQAGAVQAGNPSAAFKAVALNGDAITGSITAPSGGGACSFSLSVQASAVALEGN